MYPSYIDNNINGNKCFSTINQQWTTSPCFYNHEDLANFKQANMQSTIEKCSNNNKGKFVVADSVNCCFNIPPVILENSSTTGINRSSKKDRHSKINTARGPRDRRMRLSLDVATKFFRLQDMLNFDKASNTIEWLLEKSKPAIRDLHTQQLNQNSCSFMGLSINSPSSASECEVVSGIDDQSMEKTGEDKVSIIKEKKKIQRGVRKSSVYINHSLAKETREKARARARKRTTEKTKIKLDYEGSAAAGSMSHQFSKLRPGLDQILMDQNTTRLGSWIPFGEINNQVHLTDQAPSSYFQFKQGIVGDSSSMHLSSSWSPSFFFGYQHNPAGGLSHEHQLISDLQILGKPWEGINN